MKKTLHIILAVVLAITSCVKQTNRGENFRCEFNLITPVFYDGEDVKMQLKSNRSEVKVIGFTFSDSPEYLTTNSYIDLTEGIWETSKAVHFSQTHRGIISLTLQDPITGQILSFEAGYTALASTGANIVIENSTIQKVARLCKDDDADELPVIVGTDKFIFTVYSKAESLILKDFSCEFNDGQLVTGKRYRFEEGSAHFEMSHKDIQSDGYEKARTLSLTLSNEETGRDTVITARYLNVTELKPIASISPSNFKDGDRVTLRVDYNRPREQAITLRQAITDSDDGWFERAMGLQSGMTCEFNAGDYWDLRVDEVTVTEEHVGPGNLILRFEDTNLTGRSVSVTVPYTASLKPDPKSVILDRYADKYNTEDVFLIKISTSETGTSNLFYAEGADEKSKNNLSFSAPEDMSNYSIDNLSPTNTFKQPKEATAINGGGLFVKIGLNYGDYKIKVWPAGKESAYKEFELTVRKDIALKLTGSFFFYGYVKNSKSYGWNGFPKEITAELVEYSSTAEPITSLDEINYTESLDDSTHKPFSIEYAVIVNNKFECQYFYKPYKELSYPYMYFQHVDVYNTYGYGNVHNMTQHLRSATMPSYLQQKITEDSTQQTILSCEQLTGVVRDMACNVNFWWNGVGENSVVKYDYTASYGNFEIRVTKVTYNRDDYRLKYIFNYIDSATPKPWWRDNFKCMDDVQFYSEN